MHNKQNTASKLNFDLHSKIFIGFAIVFILLFIAFWYNSTKNIEEYKKEKDCKIDHLKKIKTNLIDIQKLKQKNSIITISKDDLIEINSNINALSQEVYNERNRAESIIDKDIDRLNLYMAIGIGFMTLFGIFAPILVNILSVSDLKDKIKEMPQKKTIDKLTQDTQTALNNSEKITSLSENLTNVETEYNAISEKMNTITPQISTISLQIAINRLFNLSPSAITDITRRGDYFLYKNLFDNIKNELIECRDNNNHSLVGENKSICETLYDFSKMLNDEKFQFNSFINNKRLQESYTKLADSISDLANSNTDNETENYNLEIDNIEELTNKITNAQNQPTT
ncbi:MAG: hypothetical protein PHP27_05170 [Bacteroidales bacterium]|nr:hypothetical protein [Bacteroidales bacterium]